MKRLIESPTTDVVLGGLVLVAMIVAMFAALIYAPTERVQGDVQRIFYVHLAVAWNAYLAFFVVFVASIAYLWRRRPSAGTSLQG